MAESTPERLVKYKCRLPLASPEAESYLRADVLEFVGHRMFYYRGATKAVSQIDGATIDQVQAHVKAQPGPPK